MTKSQSAKLTGILFVVIPVLINIPYGMLIANFQYPDILRQPAGEILTKFHAGGAGLILTWWAFALVGLPLIYAVIGLHGLLQSEDTPYLAAGTTCGVFSLVAQFLGLLRWVFVVPVLANAYADPGASETTKQAATVTFQAVHQYGGVVIGEHIGQLFTIAWMLLASTAMLKSPDFKPWLGWMGIGSALFYLLAQLELIATVIPAVPVVEIAGFLGSVLWLVWMILIGVRILRTR